MNPLQDIVLLDPSNFTSLSRTPWAGHYIAEHFKNNFTAPTNKIGEAWDFSCDPELPSDVALSDMSLPELIATDPKMALSAFQNHRTNGKCEILVKLLNAAEPLSLQVHPRDDDPSLHGDECGKPESWYILDAAPGAGLYLGFSEPLTLRQLRDLLIGDPKTCQSKLNFVPVKAGDYFELAPGVPHAIGPGVTLLEPQRVKSGCKGKTYRLWDWGRKYDSRGHEDPNGKARELHLEEGLRLVDPQKQVGPAFVETLRRQAAEKTVGDGVFVQSFPMNLDYQTHIITMQPGTHSQWNFKNGFGCAITLFGGWHTASENSTTVVMGQPVFIPHGADPLSVESHSGTKVALITPAGSQFQVC